MPQAAQRPELVDHVHHRLPVRRVRGQAFFDDHVAKNLLHERVCGRQHLVLQAGGDNLPVVGMSGSRPVVGSWYKTTRRLRQRGRRRGPARKPRPAPAAAASTTTLTTTHQPAIVVPERHIAKLDARTVDGDLKAREALHVLFLSGSGRCFLAGHPTRSTRRFRQTKVGDSRRRAPAHVRSSGHPQVFVQYPSTRRPATTMFVASWCA